MSRQRRNKVLCEVEGSAAPAVADQIVALLAGEGGYRQVARGARATVEAAADLRLYRSRVRGSGALLEEEGAIADAPIALYRVTPGAHRGSVDGLDEGMGLAAAAPAGDGDAREVSPRGGRRGGRGRRGRRGPAPETGGKDAHALGQRIDAPTLDRRTGDMGGCPTWRIMASQTAALRAGAHWGTKRVAASRE